MKKTILIVDDQAEFRYLIKFNLEYSGYDTIEASDIIAGLELTNLLINNVT